MKMAIEVKKQLDNLDLFQRRIEILAGARLRERNRIKSAVELQNKIRKRIGKWHGSAEIRKWRAAA